MCCFLMGEHLSMMYMAAKIFQIYLKVGLGGGAEHIDNIAPPKRRAVATLPKPMNTLKKTEMRSAGGCF